MNWETHFSRGTSLVVCLGRISKFHRYILLLTQIQKLPFHQTPNICPFLTKTFPQVEFYFSLLLPPLVLLSYERPLLFFVFSPPQSESDHKSNLLTRNTSTRRSRVLRNEDGVKISSDLEVAYLIQVPSVRGSSDLFKLSLIVFPNGL